MFENPFHRSIYLTGATAVGKSAVGVTLARRIDAEIIALDSMTLYRGMNLGTAKSTEIEQGGIRHHLIDVIDPWESASVADYRTWALEAVLDIERRGKRALFVGGTALYLKALLRGLFEGPGADAAVRKGLEAEADQLGDPALHARLSAVDPATARRLHPNDRRRVVRALEVLTMTGRPLSEHQTEHDRPAPEAVSVFALERPRPELHARIDQRVVQMFEERLIDEVRGLLHAEKPLHPVPAQGVGYREVIDFLEGRLTQAELIPRVQTRTRQFAKRQGTWFRGLAEVQVWPVHGPEAAEATAERLAARLAGSN